MALSKLSISKKQSIDSGLAIVLICLIIAIYFNNLFYTKLAIIFLLISMIWPVLYKPFAFFWFGLSNILGNIVSKCILAILFFTIVTPIGLIRRVIGKDSLKLNEWKANDHSVFIVRNHKFESNDTEHPY